MRRKCKLLFLSTVVLDTYTDLCGGNTVMTSSELNSGHINAWQGTIDSVQWGTSLERGPQKRATGFEAAGQYGSSCQTKAGVVSGFELMPASDCSFHLQELPTLCLPKENAPKQRDGKQPAGLSHKLC